MSTHDESLARAAFAPVRDIEPDEGLVARVVAQVGRRKKAGPEGLQGGPVGCVENAAHGGHRRRGRAAG